MWLCGAMCVDSICIPRVFQCIRVCVDERMSQAEIYYNAKCVLFSRLLLLLKQMCYFLCVYRKEQKTGCYASAIRFHTATDSLPDRLFLSVYSARLFVLSACVQHKCHREKQRLFYSKQRNSARCIATSDWYLCCLS